MKWRLRVFLFLGLFVFVGVLAYFGSFPSEQSAIGVGEKAPDFDLPTLDGGEIKLSELAGKKVIINFWATWCEPCKTEIPDLQEYYTDNKNEVEILAVNMGKTESNMKNIEDFVSSMNLSFPILLDSDGEVEKKYQTITIPTSYIIDSDGILRDIIMGPLSKHKLEEMMQRID